MSWESGSERTCRLLPGGSCKHSLTLADVTAQALMSGAHAVAFPETEEKGYGTAE